MAYADSIRTSSATMEGVATLIEGIFSSGFPATFTTWSPTYTASGSMTATSPTTAFARYLVIGKVCFIQIGFTVTMGGTASTELRFTLPFTATSSVNTLWMSTLIRDNGTYKNGHIGVGPSATYGVVRPEGLGNWAGTGTAEVYAGLFYETA